MNIEIEKLEQYFTDLETHWASNPGRIGSVEVFEAWEQSCLPGAFMATGPLFSIGERKLRLPAKRKYLVHAGWDFQRSRPELIADDSKHQYRFVVTIRDGNVEFHDGEKCGMSHSFSDEGKKIEVIYDIIDSFLSNKPDADIFKLKKAEFVELLGALEDSYDIKFLNQMARLPAADIRGLVEKAACDMAIDDLRSQLCLPLEKSYAYGAGSETKIPKIETGTLYPRTLWEIVRELELLRDVARLSHDVQRQYVMPLNNSEVVCGGELLRTIIRVKNAGDLVFHEGVRLNVVDLRNNSRVGTFVVGLFDYDTLYGEILWDVAGESKNLERLCLQPQVSQHRAVLSGVEALLNLVKKSPGKVAGALRAVLGLDPAALATDLGEGESGLDMDCSQLRGWSAAVDPLNAVTAVQGPPGAGKTWLLARIIRHLCRQRFRLLITAPSNKAVDNVCASLIDLPILRFGQAAKVDPKIRDTCWANERDNVDRFLKKYKPGKTGSIYAATHVRALTDKVIQGDWLKRGLFDWVIFDEAGMSRMDEFLLCAQLGKRVLVFGDQQQLPPFPLSAEVLKRLREERDLLPSPTLRIIDCGALEWLATVRKMPLILLERSYRCQNPRLMRFSSTLFYNAKVKTSETAEYFQLPYYQRKKTYPRSTLRFYCTSSLPENIRKERIIVEDAKIGIENPCEANICRHVVLESLLNHSLEQIAIITPYKLQADRIRAMLGYDLVRNFFPTTISAPTWNDFLNARIATVDSFQGGESDMVIISYVRSNQDKGIGFVDSPNRINVAHTRCRRAIAIIGDLECLKKQARTDIFARMERAFARDGEIVDLDEDLLDRMSRLPEH
jgi:hypothetical protein